MAETTSFNGWLQQAIADNPTTDPRALVDYHRQTYGFGPNEEDYAQWADAVRGDNPGATDDALRQHYAQTYGELDTDAGAAGDLWTRVKQGGLRIPGAVTALADIVATPLTQLTGHALFSEGADWLGEQTGFQPGQWADELNQDLSPAGRRTQAEINQAWDTGSPGEIAAAYFSNPVRGIGGLVAESLPMTLAGGMVGRGIGALGRAAAAAAPEASMAARVGQAVDKGRYYLGEGAIAGGVATDQLLQQDVDPRVATLAGLGTAVTTGAFGALGGRVANRLGLRDLDMAVAGVQREALQGAQRSLGTRLLGGAAIEGLVEELPQSVTEQMWQNLALGNPLMEGTARAGVEGALAGTAMGGMYNAMPRGPRVQKGQPTDLTTDPGSTPENLVSTRTMGDLLQQQGLAPPAARSDKAQKKAQKDYEKAFNDAWNATSDITWIDPETQQEVRLTEGQRLGLAAQLAAGPVQNRLAPEPVQVPPVAPGGAPRSLTDPPAPVPAAKPVKVSKAQRNRVLSMFDDENTQASARDPARLADLVQLQRELDQTTFTDMRSLDGMFATETARGDTVGLLRAHLISRRQAALQVGLASVRGELAQNPQALDMAPKPTPEQKKAQDAATRQERAQQEWAAKVASVHPVVQDLATSENLPTREITAADKYWNALRTWDEKRLAAERTKLSDVNSRAPAWKSTLLGLFDEAQAQAGAANQILQPRAEEALAQSQAPGDPAGETPAPVTAQADPGAEQAAPLATPPALTDVVGAVRTALTDAKGITPAQRETLDLWLNTPDGSDATFADIGEQLGITTQAAHKRVQTALSTLRSHPAVKAFAPQVRGLLSQTRAPSITENAAPTADNLAALASQNGVDQLDQRSIATTGGQLVDTADLAEGGNLTPSTTKTQIGLTEQQTDLTGGSTDAAAIRSARAMSKAAREALAADPTLLEALQEEERTALAPLAESIPDPAANIPTEEFVDAETGQVVEQQREPEPGELVWRQKEQVSELGAMRWDDIPDGVRQWFGDMMSNPNFEPTQAWINDTIQSISRRLAPKTKRVVGAGQGEVAQSPARLGATDGSRVDPGLDRKNAALTRGTEPGTNDYQPAQSADEVAAVSVGTFDPAIGEIKYGEAQAQQPTTRQAFERVLQELLGRTNHWRVTLHDTAEQARQADVSDDVLRGTSGRGAYGWVETKNGKTHATFILERVQAGQELSALMHEVGAHLGMESILSGGQFQTLYDKIAGWAALENSSRESRIAQAALARVAQARTEGTQQQAETIAYFVEEAVRAGVNPTAMSHKGELARWFRTLWAAFKIALRKLGVRNVDSLTAQHVVDLAYGAARLELAGQWHGTAANFRRFNNDFANTGEGTQIEGSGIYLTPDQTRAMEYAVGSALNNPEGEVNVMRVDTPVSPDRLLHWDKPLSEQPVPVREAIAESGLVSDLSQRGRDLYTSLAAMLGSPRSASDFLDAMGVYGTFRPQDGGDHVVIFNDRNTFRVGRAPGGDLSQIRYGEPAWAPPAQIQRAIDKLPEPLQDPVAHVVDSVRTAVNKTHLGLAFTKDLADFIKTKAPPFAEAVDRYMTNIQAAKVERITRDTAVSDILARYHALKLDAIQKPAMKFLADARVQGKWGYDPRKVVPGINETPWTPPGYEDNEAVVVDPKMAEAFGKLTPAARRVVVDINRLLAENFQKVQELIIQNINRVYDKRVAQINERIAAETDPKKRASLDKQLAKTQADRASMLKAFSKKLIKTKGPYAPLKRHGNYVVQAFSPELKALFDKGETRTREENNRYNELRRDEKHYTLEFVANRHEARKRLAALSETFGENVDAWEKTSWRDRTYVGLPEVDRLRALVTEGVGEPGNARLVRDVENLALQVMADTHARQAQHHAKLIPGFDPDMIRSFVAQARADAYHIANLLYLDEINDSIQQMTRMAEDPKVRAKTGVDRDTLGRMVSELHRRWGNTLRYEPSPVVDRLAAVSSTWHLLLSPAYYFQNATQVGMMSVPWMAGTYGWAKTQRAVLKAYQDILPMVKDKARSWEHFDTTLVPEDVRHVIAALKASGQINIFMDLELGQAAATSNTAMGKLGRTFDQTIRRLPAKVETINRVVTAIAAYRLATTPGSKQMAVADAIKYAGKVIDITHGDYDGINAPRWISPGMWGPSAKLLFQFRKFQLIQLAFYARMFNDMTASHPLEVRKAAAKALTFSLAHTTLAAGAMGLPAMGVIQVIASLFGDDDEPDDKAAQDIKIRQAMKNGGMPDDMVDLVLGGLPALLGIDMTGKLGSQHLLTPLPYTQLDPQEQGNFEKLATAALGPTAGMVGKFYRGFGDLQRGEYLAGFEKMLGSGIGDAVQAARLATKGEQTYNTDQAFSPEELGLATAIAAGLGFTPEILSKRWAGQRALKSYKTTFDRRTAEIKRAYSAAVNDGGSRKDVRQLRQEWLDLQKAKKEAGFRPSPLGELVKTPMEQRRRERDTLGGIKFDRGNRAAVERIDRVLN